MADLTPEQIDALYEQHIASKPASAHSPEEINALYDQHIGAWKPLSTPDSPVEKDIFNSTENRAAASFGNQQGVLALLRQQGYKDAKTNSAGDLVFQDASGNWVKDENNFFPKGYGLTDLFTAHPINWAAANLGKALPVMGAAAGGAGAGTAAGVGTVGMAAAPAIMAGGAAGGAAGEGLRQAVGRYMGVYQGGAGESAKDLAEQGVSGAAQELGGQVLGPPLKVATEETGRLMKEGVSRVSSLLTSVPKEAIQQLIERPEAVLSASQPGIANSIAKAGQAELAQRAEAESTAIMAARRKSVALHGPKPIDTSSLLTPIEEFAAEKAPTAEGIGPLSPKELEDINNLHVRAVTSENFDPNTPQFYEKKSQDITAKGGIGGGTVANPKGARRGQVAAGLSSEPSFAQNTGNFDADMQRMASPPDLPQRSPYGGMASLVGAKEPPTGVGPTYGGQGSRSPVRSFADLQKYADWLKKEVDTFDQSKLPNKSDTPYQAMMRGRYGKVKELMHQVDPELKAADAQYHNFANDVKLLKNLDKPHSAESFISNFYGPNKTELQSAAERLIPNTVERIKDLAAAKELNKPGALKGQIFGSAGALGSIGSQVVDKQGHRHYSLLPALAGLGMAAGTNPTANKVAIGQGSKLIQYLYSHPATLPLGRALSARAVQPQVTLNGPGYLNLPPWITGVKR